MEGMTPPGPEHEVLAKFVGSWIGDETMLPSPWSPEASQRASTLDVRMLDGFFAISDYVQTSGDEVSFRGHGVYSWDPQNGHYVMHWFDSMGGAGALAHGSFDGTRLTFQSTSPMGHHRYRYLFDNDDAYRFEMAMSPDGETWQNLMEGKYRRRS